MIKNKHIRSQFTIIEIVFNYVLTNTAFIQMNCSSYEINVDIVCYLSDIK